MYIYIYIYIYLPTSGELLESLCPPESANSFFGAPADPPNPPGA